MKVFTLSGSIALSAYWPSFSSNPATVFVVAKPSTIFQDYFDFELQIFIFKKWIRNAKSEFDQQAEVFYTTKTAAVPYIVFPLIEPQGSGILFSVTYIVRALLEEIRYVSLNFRKPSSLVAPFSQNPSRISRFALPGSSQYHFSSFGSYLADWTDTNSGSTWSF